MNFELVCFLYFIFWKEKEVSIGVVKSIGKVIWVDFFLRNLKLD